MKYTLSTLRVTAYAGAGSIRIDPPLPYASETPAYFTIWVQGADAAYDPHIFLVMTNSSYHGVGSVKVTWDGAIWVDVPPGTWIMADSNGQKLPPLASNGAGYTVASLKSHLSTSDPIYWAFVSILDGHPLATGTNYTIGITLESTDPSMLVYILGKSEGSNDFDMRVPPTIPGFVIPEIPFGSLAVLASMIGAMGLYILLKK